MTNEYIEFRVYLKPDSDMEQVSEEAEQMKDTIADLVSDELAPKIFTQDVTYQIVVVPEVRTQKPEPNP
jgi:hypothetical protein